MLPQIKILLVFGMLLLIKFTAAQNDSSIIQDSHLPDQALYFSAGMGGSAGVGNFQRKYDQTAFDYHFTAGVKVLKDQYIFTYLDLAFHRLESVAVNYFVNNGPFIYEERHRTSAQMMDLTAGIRYELPQIWYLIPYIQGSFGARNAYLSNTITDVDADEIIESFRTLSDWNYVAIIGAGLSVPLTPQIFANLSFNYSNSGTFDIYLPPTGREGNIINNDPVSYYDLNKTTTDLWGVQVGISIYLP